MPIKVSCVCGNELSVADYLAGQQAKCPRCRRRISVPTAASAGSKQKTGKNKPIDDAETPHIQRPKPVPESQGQILSAVMPEDRENSSTPVDLKAVPDLPRDLPREVQWCFGRGDEKRGPLSETEALEIAKRGELLATDLVWRKGMSQWTPAGESPEWKQYFRKPEPTPDDLPPPLPAELPPPLPAKTEPTKEHLSSKICEQPPSIETPQANTSRPGSATVSEPIKKTPEPKPQGPKTPKPANTGTVLGCIGILVLLGGLGMVFKKLTPSSITRNQSRPPTDSPEPETSTPSSTSPQAGTSSKYNDMNLNELALEIDTNLIVGQGFRPEANWRTAYGKILERHTTVAMIVLQNGGLLAETKGECQVAIKALYVKLGGHIMTDAEIRNQKEKDDAQAIADAAEDAKYVTMRTAPPQSGGITNEELQKRLLIEGYVDAHTLLVRVRSGGDYFMISGIVVRKFSKAAFAPDLYWEEQDKALFERSGKRTYQPNVLVGDNKQFDVYSPRKSK